LTVVLSLDNQLMYKAIKLWRCGSKQNIIPVVSRARIFWWEYFCV